MSVLRRALGWAILLSMAAVLFALLASVSGWPVAAAILIGSLVATALIICAVNLILGDPS